MSAHSMKSTTLAWCAKFGIWRDDRLLLGHHSENGSAEVYARNVQAALLAASMGSETKGASKNQSSLLEANMAFRIMPLRIEQERSP